MRARNTALSLVVVVVLLVLLVLAVQQNPQSVDWTLFGQSFTLNAGVAIASAMLIGFLLAALFVVAFVGAPTSVITATTETQAGRDLIKSREQHRQLQAEHSRMQIAYNQLLNERDRAQNAPATAAVMPSEATAQVHPASPLYPMSAPLAMPPAIPSGANANIAFPATSSAPTDTRSDTPPSRQVIRPDGTIVGSENDAPPPSDDSTDYRPSH